MEKDTVRNIKASIVIPAYNEAEAIEPLLRRFQDGNYANRYEIIIIDDGSTDGTGNVVAKYPVRLIKHRSNRGYGAALKTGMRAAISEKVVLMDSDGQHSPEYIDQVVELLDQFPMVIGERDEDSHQVANRVLGKKIIRIIGEFLVEQKLPDYNSGFRGYRKKYIMEMLSIMPNGFSFSTTSTLAFLKHGYDIGLFPINVTERVGRKSNVKFVKDGTRTLLLISRIIMLFNPLKIFLPTSIALAMLGCIWTGFGLFFYMKIPNGGLLLLITSMLLFFIGLVADQVSMLNLRESNNELK